ncbi:MAG TPA: thioesterase family protein [Solirubrobacteraceae bacterium]|jgi:acyl-CoA thioesterase
MSQSIFTLGEDGRLTPTSHARGPWDPNALHGGAPAALITSVFERIQPGEQLPFARLSFSFLRPVPLAPLALDTQVIRPGRRVQELQAELRAEGELVCRASALRIQAVPEPLPQSALDLLEQNTTPALAGPEQGHAIHFALDDTSRDSFAASAMEMRFLRGQPLAGASVDQQAPAVQALSGSAAVWMRMRHPLLPGEPLTPLARLAGVADFGNGVSAVLPFQEYVFINADLLITLERQPRGEWIALDALTLLHPGGVGWSRSVMHDQYGRVGLATQALVVGRR